MSEPTTPTYKHDRVFDELAARTETVTASPDQYLVLVKTCKRCGNDHPNLRFVGLNNPVDGFNWWAMCPEVGQPLLLNVEPKSGTLHTS